MCVKPADQLIAILVEPGYCPNMVLHRYQRCIDELIGKLVSEVLRS
jgi:hypothetical protein